MGRKSKLDWWHCLSRWERNSMILNPKKNKMVEETMEAILLEEIRNRAGARKKIDDVGICVGKEYDYTYETVLVPTGSYSLDRKSQEWFETMELKSVERTKDKNLIIYRFKDKHLYKTDLIYWMDIGAYFDFSLIPKEKKKWKIHGLTLTEKIEHDLDYFINSIYFFDYKTIDEQAKEREKQKYVYVI